MRGKYIEAGQIVNTHGTRGEVKLTVYLDSAEFLAGFSVYYIHEKPVPVESARVHKGCVLAKLSGVDTVEQAMALKGVPVWIDRADAGLSEGEYFIQDILGFSVYDERLEKDIGHLSDVLNLPASDVYAVRGASCEILIPAVPEFVKRIDFNREMITVRTIPGMGDEEDGRAD